MDALDISRRLPLEEALGKFLGGDPDVPPVASWYDGDQVSCGSTVAFDASDQGTEGALLRRVLVQLTERGYLFEGQSHDSDVLAAQDPIL